jgi:hypothetical protein
MGLKRRRLAPAPRARPLPGVARSRASLRRIPRSASTGSYERNTDCIAAERLPLRPPHDQLRPFVAMYRMAATFSPYPRSILLGTALHRWCLWLERDAVERRAASGVVRHPAPSRSHREPSSTPSHRPRRRDSTSPLVQEMLSKGKSAAQGTIYAFTPSYPNGRPHSVIGRPQSVVYWQISGKQRQDRSPESHSCWWARQGLNL